MPRPSLDVPIPEKFKEQLMTDQEAIDYISRDSQQPEPKTTTYLGVPIRQEHSIRVMARKIIRHNQKRQFTSISNIGESGAGKTSSTTNLVHEIHTLAEKDFDLIYSVRWVGKEELLNFDQFLKSLEPVAQILIFEDISYALDLVKKKDKLRIKSAFTEIRHTMGEVNVICIFHYHYTKAMDKMMRASKYSIITSVNNEERSNLLALFGSHNREYIDKLAYRKRGMNEMGWCTVPLDDHAGKQYVYHWGKPFDIALSDQHGKLHFIFYANYKTSDKVWCNHCIPFPIGTKADPRSLYETLKEEFGEKRARSVIKWWGFVRGGRNCIDPDNFRAWRFLNNFTARHPTNIDDLIDYIETIRKKNIINKQLIDRKADKLENKIMYNTAKRTQLKKLELTNAIIEGLEQMFLTKPKPTTLQEGHIASDGIIQDEVEPEPVNAFSDESIDEETPVTNGDSDDLDSEDTNDSF